MCATPQTYRGGTMRRADVQRLRDETAAEIDTLQQSLLSLF